MQDRSREYLSLYNEALRQYSNQERAGYTKTCFSRWRHSYKPYPRIMALEQALKEANDSKTESKKDPKDIIKKHFNDPKSTFNNHSFNMFFLDLLVKSFPEEKWEQYYPKAKRVCFYQPRASLNLNEELSAVKKEELHKYFESKRFLFRGSLQTCEDAFANGMKELEASPQVEAYAKINNLSVGVSTSKSYSQASVYAQTSRLFYTPTRAIYNASLPSYVYVIHYRGIGGIDIEETLRARKGTLSSSEVFRCEKEVNIVHRIPPEDIVGAWSVNSNEFIRNPRYQAKGDVEVMPPSDPLRIRQLFT